MTSKWLPYFVIGTVGLMIAVLLAGVFVIGAEGMPTFARIGLISLLGSLLYIFSPGGVAIVGAVRLLFGGAPLVSKREMIGLSMMHAILLGVGQSVWAAEIIALRRDMEIISWVYIFGGVIFLGLATICYRLLKTAK